MQEVFSGQQCVQMALSVFTLLMHVHCVFCYELDICMEGV